jgi:hypothetical protein
MRCGQSSERKLLANFGFLDDDQAFLRKAVLRFGIQFNFKEQLPPPLNGILAKIN